MSTTTPPHVLWSKHRVEALTDGIFAVAMTLLVIELKLPEARSIGTQHELAQAVADLVPKAISWILSFYVLAIFWISHHRLYHYVRFVDSSLLWRNLHELAFVSLMPFSAAMIGAFTFAPIAQVIYNGNMAMLGLISLWKLRYVRQHPELTNHSMGTGTYHAALLRIGTLIVAALCAIGLSFTPVVAFATLIYLIMIPLGIFARRIDRKGSAAASTATAAPAGVHP